MSFCCIKCKTILQINSSQLICENCNNLYVYKNGFYDFCQDYQKKKYIIPNEQIQNLLKEINNTDYQNGIENFVKNNPMFKSQLMDTKFDQSLDSVFHGIGENNSCCLVVGSIFGNKAEILSHMFDEVYSLEILDEMLIFQNHRFNEEGIENITLLKCRIEELPFNENFFDLIVLGTSFTDFLKYYGEIPNNLTGILNEFKRVLKKGGCLCLDIENNTKFGKFFPSQNTTRKKLGIDPSKYSEILQKIGFRQKTYWVLPSLDRPYFSSNIDDGIAIDWYLRNFINFIKGTKIHWKYRIFYKIFPLMGKKILKSLTKKYAPYFVFCCFKDTCSKTIEDHILKETEFSNCFTISRRIKTTTILINNSGKAKYIVHFKRYGREFPKKIPLVKREFPDYANPDNRIWMEGWKKGKILDPFNSEQIIAAIKWLFKFQDNSKQELLTENDIQEEISMIRKYLVKAELKNDVYDEWLEKYKKFILTNQIKKTARHGDFSYANILYDEEAKEVNPVDWENFSPNSTPFRDLIDFIIRLMMLSSRDEVKAFETKIKDDEHFKKLIFQINKLAQEHFECAIDIDLILKYAILRKVAELFRDEKNSRFTYIKLLNIVEKNNLLSSKKGDL